MNKRTSRGALVNQYLSRVASGKSTKRVTRKLSKTKEGRRLSHKRSRSR